MVGVDEGIGIGVEVRIGFRDGNEIGVFDMQVQARIITELIMIIIPGFFIAGSLHFFLYINKTG